MARPGAQTKGKIKLLQYRFFNIFVDKLKKSVSLPSILGRSYG